MYIKEILRTEGTVFTTQELAVLFGLKRQYLKVVLNRLVVRNDLVRIVRGLYAVKGKEVDFLELASKLKYPSYVSMETILAKNGIIFQDYSQTVFSVSNNSLKKNVWERKFEYRKIKDSILKNPLGIENKNRYMTASSERAICDCLYFCPGYYFDNLSKINLDKLWLVASIYGNKRLEKEVKKIINNLQENA